MSKAEKDLYQAVIIIYHSGATEEYGMLPKQAEKLLRDLGDSDYCNQLQSYAVVDRRHDEQEGEWWVPMMLSLFPRDIARVLVGEAA